MSDATVREQFIRQFHAEPSDVSYAPGRVNLIGEHTDYNDGLVFPAAINYGTWIAFRPRSDRKVRAYAVAYDQWGEFSIDHLNVNPDAMWLNYLQGVAQALMQRDIPVRGADLVIFGNVPQGAGLSSSASLEIALCPVLADAPLTGETAAKVGQAAENNFVGTQCGIMDQLISARGVAGHALRIDCQDLSCQPCPLPDSHEILIINSAVRRGLVDSEYNTRRQQCERAAAHFNVPTLRHVSLEQLLSAQSNLPDDVFRRARHVLTENQRVDALAEALAQADWPAVRKHMSASHASMRDDFEITVPAIDWLVEQLQTQLGDTGGARMTGGGFGGCVVALAPTGTGLKLFEQIKPVYTEQFQLDPVAYICQPSQGPYGQQK